MCAIVVIFLYAINLVFPYAQGASCTLPWVGVWIKTEWDFNITQHSFGPLGTCRSKENDQYLLGSVTNRGECYRCLIVFPVHENVLQYKTTQCIFDSSMTMDRCRYHFSGDTSMHTLFRKDASPIQCPIETPLNFTYHTSDGSCSSRTSSITRCSQWTRISFHYQACPENPTKEASVSEVECIASWQSLGHNFFAARVGNQRGESYRCFIVDRSGTSGRIGISADASCQELTHISSATITLQYKQDHEIYPQCNFPDYLQANHGRARQSWDSIVDGKRNVIENGYWISSYKSRNDSLWTCLESQQLDNAVAIRTHVRRDCRTGFQCVQLYQRSSHLVQLSFGKMTSNEYEDCSEGTLESHDILVLHGTLEDCPLRGQYSSSNCNLPVLSIGCQKSNEMQVYSECGSTPIDSDVYTCIAHFQNANEHYLIVRDTISMQLQCIKFLISGRIVLQRFDHISCDPSSTTAALPSSVVNISNRERCESSFLAGFLHYSENSLSSRGLITSSAVIFLTIVLLS